jgi:hypothetical protein
MQHDRFRNLLTFMSFDIVIGQETPRRGMSEVMVHYYPYNK